MRIQFLMYAEHFSQTLNTFITIIIIIIKYNIFSLLCSMSEQTKAFLLKCHYQGH